MNSPANNNRSQSPATSPDAQRGRFMMPADFCRLSPALSATLQRDDRSHVVVRSAMIITITGTALYGFAFGIWHSGYQAFISSIKLPALFFAVVASSTMLNTVLAQLMGYGFTFRQVCGIILTGMTVTATILGAWSPVAMFLALQTPGRDPALLGLSVSDPAAAASMRVYQIVLLANTAAIGAAGVMGNLKLYRLLVHMTGSARSALRLLTTWMAVMGFVGCQLSWLLSPFLGNPVSSPYWFFHHTWKENFYEYVFRSLENLASR